MFDETADAVDVEHAPSHQIAGVNLVVITETQALQLLEIGELQTIADTLPDGLTLVVVSHGKETAQNRSADQEGRRRDQGRFGLGLGRDAAAQQPGRVIDRLAEEARNQELEYPRRDDGNDRHREAKFILQSHLRHTP